MHIPGPFIVPAPVKLFFDVAECGPKAVPAGLTETGAGAAGMAANLQGMMYGSRDSGRSGTARTASASCSLGHHRHAQRRAEQDTTSYFAVFFFNARRNSSSYA